MRYNHSSQRPPEWSLSESTHSAVPWTPYPRCKNVSTYILEKKLSSLNCFRTCLSAHRLLFAKQTSLPAHLYSQCYLRLENSEEAARLKKRWNRFSCVLLSRCYNCHLIEMDCSCSCSHSSLAFLVVVAVEPLQGIRRRAVLTVV